jgi:mRNA-degrading endonuclease RelE of RelBE toxin-antitoxin system
VYALIFIETSLFTRLLPKYLSDDEYRAFQFYLLALPEAGKVVRGSGGVRKIRWRQGQKGKRGSIRIIYFWKKSEDEIWLLTLYAKSDQATIAPDILRKIAREIENE